MKNVELIKADTESPPNSVRVWDLPTRLFHWLLVIFVIISFVTGKMGGNAMQYHAWSGFTILTLLLFRLVWGFVGSRESRFTKFVRGPSAVVRYATTLVRRDSAHYLGHNPLGGWSIIATLLALLVQAGTGLFANDDIITEGPLFDWVSKATSDWLTRIHKLNQEVIVALVFIHVLAVLFYFFYKRENLIKPMITGVKQWSEAIPQTASGRTWTAAVIAGLAALAVYLLVR
ncbi:MAG: cytochrome b/b6 domain-containing protein [Desulfobacterales bacterium]|jgi:cytochrome b